MLYYKLAEAPVGFPVGGDHPLVGTPGRFDFSVLAVCEHFLKESLLFVGEELGTGVECAAVLNLVNPSMATTSTRSRHVWGREVCHCLNTALERPSTMSNNRAGPVSSRTGVRSMITVTYLSPRFVCRQTCSSTPTTLTPLRPVSSLMRSRCPSVRTASLAVCQDMPKPAMT